MNKQGRGTEAELKLSLSGWVNTKQCVVEAG